MAAQNNFYAPNQHLRMQQSSSPTPLYSYSHDGRDQYRHSPLQHQMQQMPLLAPLNNSTQAKGILRNSYQQVGNNPSCYSQQNDDMVRSLMAQLHQKEAELTKYKVTYSEFQKAEQNNRGLKSRLDAQIVSMAEKDKKIAMLVGKLNLEKRSNGSAVADAIADTKIKRLSEQLEENKREIKSRDDEIARLNAQNKMFMIRAIESEKSASFQTNSHLEQELTALKEKFTQVKEQNSTCKNTIEELVRRVKAKEWMINSLKSESEEHRNRETRLNAQVNGLKKTVESYDTMFGKKNSDFDVPMLLAKLADYETQVLHLQKQQADLDKHQTFKMDEESVSSKDKKFDDGTTIVSNDYSMGDTIEDDDDDEDDDDEDDDDDSTFVTMDDTFAPTTASTKYNCNPKNQVDAFNDLVEDVTDGFQSIQSDRIICGVTDCYGIFSDEPSDSKEDNPASMLDTLLGLK